MGLIGLVFAPKSSDFGGKNAMKLLWGCFFIHKILYLQVRNWPPGRVLEAPMGKMKMNNQQQEFQTPYVSTFYKKEIPLMVQKSQGQPPEMYPRPVVNNGMN